MPNLTALSRSAYALRRRLFACALCVFSTPALADAAWQSASQRPGSLAQTRLETWQQLLNTSTELNTAEKLRAVNQLINNSTRYVSDQQTWGQTEYWATPAETVKRGQGDCEDFAIAKYFSLIKMGIPSSQLRLTHAKDLSSNSAHMVLAYYPNPESQPLILDNLNGRILPSSQRQDLLMAYSFNADGIYLPNTPSGTIAQPVTLLSRWTALNTRMQGSDQLL
jgi:predicted transglutaminase-like cysteine proteinase